MTSAFSRQVLSGDPNIAHDPGVRKTPIAIRERRRSRIRPAGISAAFSYILGDTPGEGLSVCCAKFQSSNRIGRRYMWPLIHMMPPARA